MLNELEEDLRALFAHPSFRWLAKFSSWPEATKLAERIEIPNE
jgi:hypothetical protein